MWDLDKTHSFCASRGTRGIELLAVYSSQIVCSNLANLLIHQSPPLWRAIHTCFPSHSVKKENQFVWNENTNYAAPSPKQVFLHADSTFNVFTWLWQRQSQILTPIWTGKQSDDFGRSPFSIRNVALRKSVKKTWLGHIFVRNWRPNQKRTFLAGLPYPPQGLFYDSGPTGGTKTSPE